MVVSKEAKWQIWRDTIDKRTEHQPDCNECFYLNITEQQQQNNELKLRPHKCTLYNRPVLHRSIKVIHTVKLYPCEECEERSYKEFTETGLS